MKKIYCPTCLQHYEIEDEMYGKNINAPCGHSFNSSDYLIEKNSSENKNNLNKSTDDKIIVEDDWANFPYKLKQCKHSYFSIFLTVLSWVVFGICTITSLNLPNGYVFLGGFVFLVDTLIFAYFIDYMNLNLQTQYEILKAIKNKEDNHENQK